MQGRKSKAWCTWEEFQDRAAGWAGIELAPFAAYKRDVDPNGRFNAGKLLDALPANAVEADAGLRFNRIQWLRRKDRDQEAWKMLLDAPSEPNVLLDLNNWWIERRVNCREALNAGQARIAYEIAEKHGLVSGDAYIEAEFLAGWIALRLRCKA